jgi:MFS-type transporter involved in bile tolerance (Atg22 family)
VFATTSITIVSQMYPTHRTVAWTLFDFANTGFSVMIVTFGYALYFQGVVAAGSDFYWGLAVSASMLLCALIAPIYTCIGHGNGVFVRGAAGYDSFGNGAVCRSKRRV